jgi:hypothetical protein
LTTALLDDLDLSGVLDAGDELDGVIPAITAKEVERAMPAVSVAAAAPIARRGGRQPLIFDLETVPDESRLELFGLPELPTPRAFTPADQLPDPVALMGKKVDEIKKSLDGLWPPAEWIELAKQKEALVNEKPRKGVLDALVDLAKSQSGEAATINEAIEARRKLLSVTPAYCKIVSIGSARGGGEIRTAVVGQDVPGFGIATEEMILKSFWQAVSECSPLIGFGIIHFDLPVIFIRSAILGIRPTKLLDMTPWKGEVIDLSAKIYPKGPPDEEKTGKPSRLKTFARIFGFEIPAEGVDGSHVYRLFKEGKLDEIAKYQASDIDVTRRFYEMLKGYYY